jgi:hypothetical protein
LQSRINLRGNVQRQERPLASIPKSLHEHINGAFPATPCLIATTLPNGYVQVTPRGSVLVFDDNTIAWWERGKGTTNAALKDGTKVTIFFRKPALRESGLLPKGGVVRIYGTAKLEKSGPRRDQIWQKVVQPEKDRDPEQKGYAVSMAVERIEDLDGDPLKFA